MRELNRGTGSNAGFTTQGRGTDASPASGRMERLAAEAIRLARVAGAVHLVESTRMTAEREREMHRARASRAGLDQSPAQEVVQ